MTDVPYPRLRYRRFLGGGYRREEVLFHLRELEGRVRTLEAQLDAARERSAELGADLAAAQAQVASYRSRELELEAAVAAANRHAADLVQTAELEARALLAQADEQAARIRGEAHLKVDEVGKQLEDILRLRDTMLALLRGAVEDVGIAVGRIERGEPVFGVPAVAPGAPPGGDEELAAPTAPPEPVPGDEAIFERRVEIDAGPFAEYASLSSFERTLATLPNVEDVYVRRFADERATIELAMTHEQPLVHLLRATLPHRFEAEQVGSARLRVTLAASALAGSG